MITTRWLCAGTLFLAVAVLPQPLSAAQAAADVEQGKKLFQGMCVTCHGFEGAGGDAPSLNRPQLDRAPDDAALRSVIADGLPDRGMPRVRRLTSNELRQLVSYVRSLGRTASLPLSANTQKGEAIYKGLGCASCHIVKGQGGSLGPELTSIGRLRGVEYLRQAIVDPGGALPRGTLPIPARGFSEFLPVILVTREGREVRGMRINEDNFTIQVRDASNKFSSFRKSELELIEKQPGKSLMPGVGDRLAGSDLNDLIAYLSSLRGAP
jgi:putative heme-binding domain-containing protein